MSKVTEVVSSKDGIRTQSNMGPYFQPLYVHLQFLSCSILLPLKIRPNSLTWPTRYFSYLPHSLICISISPFLCTPSTMPSLSSSRNSLSTSYSLCLKCSHQVYFPPLLTKQILSILKKLILMVTSSGQSSLTSESGSNLPIIFHSTIYLYYYGMHKSCNITFI